MKGEKLHYKPNKVNDLWYESERSRTIMWAFIGYLISHNVKKSEKHWFDIWGSKWANSSWSWCAARRKMGNSKKSGESLQRSRSHMQWSVPTKSGLRKDNQWTCDRSTDIQGSPIACLVWSDSRAAEAQTDWHEVTVRFIFERQNPITSSLSLSGRCC